MPKVSRTAELELLVTVCVEMGVAGVEFPKNYFLHLFWPCLFVEKAQQQESLLQKSRWFIFNDARVTRNRRHSGNSRIQLML